MRAVNLVLTGMMLMLLALSCGRRRHDPRLERIWEYASDEPRKAMVALDSIDASELSESDRAFYNLTSIKAKDKAFVLHKSDSLILTVLDYYSRHKDKDLYPEALYYGGRVYYDLGDYPTSLKYFQESLDLLPENTPNLRLRCRVLSQMGGLLNDLGLYHESIPYFKDELRINMEIKDTLNMFFDHKLLGAVYLHLRKYEYAMEHLNQAENLSANVPSEFIPEIKIYKAVVNLYQNEIEDALCNIREIPQETDSLARNLLLAYASKIYHKAGVLDTAYMYAHELALSHIPDNKKTGYMVMLSPDIKHLIPKDSIDIFYDDYKRVLETTFRHQENNQALMQNAMYNYRLHDRQKQEAEHSRDRVISYVVGLIAVISILSTLIMWLFYNRKNNLVKLHEALSKLEFIEKNQGLNLKETLKAEVDNDFKGKNVIDSDATQIVKDEKSLKDELRSKCRILGEKAQSYDISPRILASRAYTRLQSFVKSKSPLPNEHNVFVELEHVINECYPDFKSRLQLLADGNLKDEHYELSMLIRCGFSPKDLSVLLGRRNSTITYRRKKLCKTLLGEELDLEAFDAIIRTL